MKNKVYWVICICPLWLFLSNCVDKFNAHLPESSIGLLIVEGSIISDSAVVFSLSRSFSLDVEGVPPDFNKVDAEVCVTGEDGSSFRGVALGNGKYRVAVGTLHRDVRYSLKIVYEGDIYTSEPQYPIGTESIDDVIYEQQGEYGDVSIRFSMQSKDAACYSWSYEEDWEVRAVYNPMCAYDPETDKIVDYDARPYSRGWCHSESSEIIIGNMEINKDNRVKDKCLYSIEADDIRFSCYYSTIVKQRKISKGEYEYYQEKIKLNEEMGGLFVPQPSELPSNIRCESSNKQAIGYVGVSLNVAEYRIFISTDDIQYRLPEGYCQGAKGLKEEYTFLDLYLMGYTIAYPDPDPRTGFKGYAWVSGGCTDVRYLGASLEKPSFWPVEINLF